MSSEIKIPINFTTNATEMKAELKGLTDEMVRHHETIKKAPWTRMEKLLLAHTIVTGFLVGVLIFLALK